jgi:ribosomal protein S18 acetylase RimI-like enzyme
MISINSISSFTLHRLTATDAADYRQLRLEGLRDAPEAFGSTLEEETARPLDWFADRLERNAVFGASLSLSSPLAGVVGFRVLEGVKERHKGLLWGMFVQPEARGAGVGKALVTRVIQYAGGLVEQIHLTVVASNSAAVRLYTSAGFKQYGLEPRALKVGGEYYDEVLMALSLSNQG